MVDRVDNIISNESLISKVNKVDKQIHNHTYIYTYISITSRQVDKVHKFLKVLHTPNYIICISVYGRQVDKVDKML